MDFDLAVNKITDKTIVGSYNSSTTVLFDQKNEKFKYCGKVIA